MFRITILLGASALLSACASSPHISASRSIAELSATARHAPPVELRKSVFFKPTDRQNLSEETISQVIDAPIKPEFPARAGVVVLSAPFTRRRFNAQTPGDSAPERFVKRLRKARHFSLVSDISPHIAEQQSIESLRELATRYRLKYLVVVSRRYAERTLVNSWGWAWLTVISIPFVPANTLNSNLLAEATLMDVRTGTFLFTAHAHRSIQRKATPFAAEEEQLTLRQQLSRDALDRLAEQFVGQCNRLVAEAERQAKQPQRAAHAPAPTLPPSGS